MALLDQDRRFSVHCPNCDTGNRFELTREDALEFLSLHRQESGEQIMPGVTTFHTPTIDHPELVIHYIHFVKVINVYSNLGIAWIFHALTNATLIGEFLERHPDLNDPRFLTSPLPNSS